jgi:uncharacterized protein YceH (UPF0502 family)
MGVPQVDKVKKVNKKVRHCTTRAAVISLQKEVEKLREEVAALRKELDNQSASASRAADAALYVANYCRR